MSVKASRTDEVNRVLAARRALMRRRILRGRVTLIVWAVLAALNLVLLFGSDNLRLPVSCTSADFCMMLHFVYPDAAGSALMMIPALLLPLLMVLAAVLWTRDSVGSALRTAIFLLIWVDVVLGLAAYFWNPAVLFGDNNIQTALAVLNLAGHLALIWLISRARRAVQSLEILPENEYEGDPFEEFRKNN